MNPLEVYVLCGERNSANAVRFLTTVAPSRSPAAIEYPFPQFADDPLLVFGDSTELIQHLEVQRNEGYSIYWNVSDGIAEQVMLFFTEDGGMIAGLGGLNVSPEIALVTIQKTVDGEFGYLTSESCPPSSVSEFVSICHRSRLATLFNGQLRPESRDCDGAIPR